MKAIFFNEPVEDFYLGDQFYEIFKDRIYAPYIYGKQDLTIVDIGANIGIATLYFSRFAKKVVSVEPSAEHFELLKSMVEYNKLENVTLINKAIYINQGNFTLYHPPNKTAYSLMSNISQISQSNEMVDAITLDDLFKENNLNHVDLLKVDIEGTEIEVFSHTSFKNIADKVDLVITERHNWTGRNPNQLKEALKNAGFTVEQIPNSADLLVAKRI